MLRFGASAVGTSTEFVYASCPDPPAGDPILEWTAGSSSFSTAA